jgi:hypothetical protein
MASAGRAPVERIVDAVVAVPISVAALARELLPSGVTRLERRVTRDLVTLRRYGVRGRSPGAAAARTPDTALGPHAAAQQTRADRDEVAGEQASSSDPGTEVTGDDGLAIAGYDQLAARQIVHLLASLTPDELTAVEAHERAHRRRQTVLARIAQLT